MGQLVLAAKVSHVPSLMLSEVEGSPLKAAREGAVRALRQLGQRARERRVSTFVVFDTHWLSNFGYHINANPASDSYLKATEVIAQPAEGVTIGYVKYPDPLKKKFSFSDKQLAVYEGEVPIKVLTKADKNAAEGPRKIAAKLNVQACDDQVCYAPGTLELTIPVLVN